MKPRKIPMPQTEADWLATGRFKVEQVSVGDVSVRCAYVEGTRGDRLVTMVGGIPRERDRRRNLPVINKLHGQLALALYEHGISSLMYNQPSTGGSSGDWDKEHLRSRTEVLARLVSYFNQKLSVADNALVGSSAGGYMAVGAAEQVQERGLHLSKLILLSPAAYPEKLECVPYGPEFTRLIRQPWDVATSPVFRRLKAFIDRGGKALTCFFEADDPPIPAYIQEYYRSFMRYAQPSGGESIVTIPGVAHNFQKLTRPRKEDEVDEDSVRATAEKFTSFLR